MGLWWWGGLVLGWIAVGWLGINRMVCNVTSGGEINRVIQKYSAKSAYKIDSNSRKVMN